MYVTLTEVFGKNPTRGKFAPIKTRFYVQTMTTVDHYRIQREVANESHHRSGIAPFSGTWPSFES
jgi:hypothetical protein